MGVSALAGAALNRSSPANSRIMALILVRKLINALTPNS
jgi:hypothetical protein